MLWGQALHAEQNAMYKFRTQYTNLIQIVLKSIPLYLNSNIFQIYKVHSPLLSNIIT